MIQSARESPLRKCEVVPPLNWINFEDEHDGHGNRTNVDRKYWNGLMKGNRLGEGGGGVNSSLTRRNRGGWREGREGVFGKLCQVPFSWPAIYRRISIFSIPLYVERTNTLIASYIPPLYQASRPFLARDPAEILNLIQRFLCSNPILFVLA